MRPERPAAADEVLPRPALRLVDAERRRTAERRAHQRVGDPVRVEAVARLVQRRPDRLEVVGAVARREADVAVRERRAERVRRRIEAPGALLEAERRRRPARRTGAARRGRTSRGGTTRRPPAPSRDELGQRGAEHREHLAHLGRRHPRLVVVEERRVRRGRPARSTRCSGA